MIGCHGYSPLSDWDADGIDLMGEFFVGMDPNASDTPYIRSDVVEDDFYLDFRKTTRTDLLESVVKRSDSLAVESWIETSPTYELLLDEGDTQIWRARTPKIPNRDLDFFRIEVDEKP